MSWRNLLIITVLSCSSFLSQSATILIDFEEFTTNTVIQDHYAPIGVLVEQTGLDNPDLNPLDTHGPFAKYISYPRFPGEDNFLCANILPWGSAGNRCKGDLEVRFVEPGNPSKRVLVKNASFELETILRYRGFRIVWLNENDQVISTQWNEVHSLDDNCVWNGLELEDLVERFDAPTLVSGFMVQNYTFGDACLLSKDMNGEHYQLDNIQFDSFDPSKLERDDKDCPANGTGFGNPCNAATGNKYQREVDFGAPGTGLSIVRHYSSQSNFELGIGKGWTMPFFKRLDLNSEYVRAYKGTGSSEGFTKINSSWLEGDDASLSLSDDETGYTVTLPNGDTEYYDLSGRIVSENKRGKVTTYNYDENDNLTSIAGPFGHTLHFTYSGIHIQSITDPSGNSITYTYDLNNNLETVTYQDGSVRRYHYENQSFPNALTGITDERGIRFSTYAYDSNGLASLTQHAVTTNGVPQEKFTLSYDNNTQTTVVTPNGTIKTLLFDENLGSKNLISSINQSDAKSAVQVFDGRNNLVSSTDEEGRVTEYVYNSDNQLKQIVKAPLTPLQRVTNLYYKSSDLDLITAIREDSVSSGNTYAVSRSYDTNLNLDVVTETGYDLSGNQYIKSTDYDFDISGRLVRVDGPRTDVSDTLSIEYYDCSVGGECGQAKSITNALGHVTIFNTYDNSGRLTKLTKPNGAVQEYNYDRRGRIQSVTTTPVNSAARTYSYIYEADGRLKTTTTPEGHILSYSYDNAGDLTTISDNLGNRIEYLYDLSGNKTSEKTYDPSGVLTKMHSYMYDQRNQLSSITTGNSVSQFDFDASGNLLQHQDANLNPTVNKYDALERIYESIDPLSGLSRFEYNIQNNVTRVVSPNGASTQFFYDDFGNTLSEMSADRGTLAYLYDLANNKVSAIDANGSTRNMTYDALGRLLSVSYPDGPSANLILAYDGALPGQNGIGLLSQLSDQSGDITYYYDGLGNITKDIRTINGKVFIVEYSYDDDDNLISMTYPSGKIVTYTRDILGQITSVNSQDFAGAQSLSLMSGITYSPFGPMKSGSYGNGHTLSIDYDNAQRITSRAINNDSNSVQSLDYQYDPAGNITQINDNVVPSSSQSFDYDGLHRLDLASGNYGTFDYVYDANSNRTQLSNASSNTDYGYLPSTNQLSSVAASSASWEYTRDSNGSLISKLDSNGEGTLYGYNQAGQLVSISSRVLIPPKGNGPPKAQDTILVNYTYNGLGQRSSKTVGSEVTFYIYGLNGELITEADGQGKIKVEYIYFNGQLLSVLVLSDQTSASAEIILDDGDNGTTSSGSWAVKSDQKGNDYNGDHLLASGGTGSVYRWTPTLEASTYDVYARWVSNNKNSNNVPYTISYSGLTAISSQDQTASNGQWMLLGNYTFVGNGSEFVEVSDSNGKTVADAVRFVNSSPPQLVSTRFYAHNDHLGTPQRLTDETGIVVWAAQYEPFGTASVEEDVDGDGTNIVLNQRFPGQYYDTESGLHYNWYRYYEPSIGRYITSDPIGLDGGLNTYGYVYQNPTKYIDPLGLDIHVSMNSGGAKGNGHVGGATNSSQTFGFYPTFPSTVAPGVVKPDSDIDGEVIIPTTPEQDTKFNNCMEYRKKNPGIYMALSRNCTKLIQYCLSSAGVSGYNNSTMPSTFFCSLVKKYGCKGTACNECSD